MTSVEFICDYCSRSFSRKYNLRNHIESFHLISSKNCNICNQRFGLTSGYVLHMSRGHNRKGQPFPECDLCGRIFTRRQNIISHMRTVHFPRVTVYKCERCYKTFTTEWSLKRHLAQLHYYSHTVCNFCNKTFKRKDSLKYHIQTYHMNIREQIRCELCGKCYSNTRNLKRHMDVSHAQASSNDLPDDVREEVNFDLSNDDNLYSDILSKFDGSSCRSCNISFQTEPNLRQHIKMKHSFKTFYKYCKISLLNKCSLCNKLFTEQSSLDFHNKIFHPETQGNAKSNQNIEENGHGVFKCRQCSRAYYSDRSLKHHIKLKHSTEGTVECQECGRVCTNKYYLASHIKIVHENQTLLKCDYCNKQFKSKRNIRRHIEFTHFDIQRYNCVECQSLFKEKPSLRKHIRAKHPNSKVFPQCHICYKRFESAKSCKIHLKLMHSFVMNTFPCDHCPVSFNTREALNTHVDANHLAKNEIYKCNECNAIFKGQDKFDRHNQLNHVNLIQNVVKQKLLPRCVLCVKDFSARKTLKRHIKKFHQSFDVDDLADYGTKRDLTVSCEECLKNFSDDYFYNIYQKLKHVRETIIFKCELCRSSYNTLEFAIHRYKIKNSDTSKTKMILSELCTAEMSDNETISDFGTLHQVMKPVSDSIMKIETRDFVNSGVKTEPMTP